MDANNLPELTQKVVQQVVRAMNDRLPRKVGIIAKQHFQQNFRESGFVDGGVQPWKTSLRQKGKGTDAKYGTLLSRRNHLMRSIQFTTGYGEVTVENPVPYATLHNEGGEISTNPTVTPEMRKFAWAMYYKALGRKRSNKKGGKGKKGTKTPPPELPPEAKKWLALALTKKEKLNIRAKIPKRQFMGDSRELNEKIQKAIQDELKKIGDGVFT